MKCPKILAVSKASRPSNREGTRKLLSVRRAFLLKERNILASTLLSIRPISSGFLGGGGLGFEVFVIAFGGWELIDGSEKGIRRLSFEF